MRYDDSLPIKFKRHTKQWLKKKSKLRRDESVSAVARDLVEKAEREDAYTPPVGQEA